jgi:hypothetical protein
MVAFVDCASGGPPCHGFSLIGQRAIADPRNRLVLDFVRIVAELEARTFVFENVKEPTVDKQPVFRKLSPKPAGCEWLSGGRKNPTAIRRSSSKGPGKEGAGVVAVGPGQESTQPPPPPAWGEGALELLSRVCSGGIRKIAPYGRGGGIRSPIVLSGGPRP